VVSLKPMNDLLATAPFEDVRVHLQQICEKISSASMVYLVAPSDLEGVLALANLEASCIDSGIRYSRRLTKSKQHIPHGEKEELEIKNDGLTIMIEPFEDTWDFTELKNDDFVRIVPLSVSIRLGKNKNKRNGALDVVSQCSAIAAMIAPNGSRVRRLRPFAVGGQWLRDSLDNTFDPIHSSIRDVLRDEGSVRVVALPEVSITSDGMIPNLSKTMLRRLKKRWGSMDYDSRSQAIGELILPTLTDKSVSTPRLEELFWHRLVVGGQEMDIYSQINEARIVWPNDEDLTKSHSGAILKSLISNGKLVD